MTGVKFEAELCVARDHLHHHADTFLSYHATLRDLLTASVSGPHTLEGAFRKEKSGERLGVTADSLNGALRSSFDATGQWTFEAVVRDGVIFDNANVRGRIGGFDLARFDEATNLAALWALCHGRRGLSDGEAFWERTLAGRPELQAISTELSKDWRVGEDPDVPRATPTLLGEIQFGNWALMYRDVLKVLAAQTQTDVDLFVYIVADGTLASMISSGTVNYAKFLKDVVTGPFSHVLTVPTWVIGIDFPPGAAPDLEALTLPGA